MEDTYRTAWALACAAAAEGQLHLVYWSPWPGITWTPVHRAGIFVSPEHAQRVFEEAGRLFYVPTEGLVTAPHPTRVAISPDGAITHTLQDPWEHEAPNELLAAWLAATAQPQKEEGTVVQDNETVSGGVEVVREKDGEPYNVTRCGLDRLEPPSDPGEG